MQVDRIDEAPDAPPWHGAELFERPDWRVELTALERTELAHLLDGQAGRPAGSEPDLRAAPALADRLRRLGRSLETGCGVALVRGLPTGSDDGGLARALWILGSGFGTPLSQGADGRRLLAVQDAGYAPSDPRFRGPYSARRLAFHTDRCDVIGFACVRPAREGGENHLLHARALRDALRREAPGSARVLERDALPYLRHTVDGGNERPFTRVPVFTETDGRFAGSLLRVLIDRADRSPDAPDLADEQRRALDDLERVAEDERLYARIRLEAGDVLFLNNWITFHRRTAFTDAEEPSERRKLHRIWISSRYSRAVDPRFGEHFGATGAGALRGGMRPSARD